MNGDGSKQRFVSTFRIQLKPAARASSAPGNGPRTVDPGASHKTDRGSLNHLDPPVFVQPLRDLCVDEGSDLTLRGLLRGSDPITVSWFHNGEVVRLGKPSFDGREATLVMRDCLPEDGGAYTCLAENCAGKTSSCAAVRVRDFETICSVQSSVSHVSASRSHVENGRSPLSPKDDGQVFREPLCTSATGNKQSPVSSPREVVPKKRGNSGKGAPPLQFDYPPQNVEVKVGETARLLCPFTGSPPIVSCWIRNKEQIVDGADVWTENTDQSSSLVIAEAKPQHAGFYTVVVKDRKSSAQHTLTLSVIERPQPPASCPVPSCVTASSLVLTWSGPCYDGGSAILGYVVEEKELGHTDWREVTDQCTSTSYRVCAGLRCRGEYCFRVRAFNKVGASEPGPESAVVRMEQKDSVKAKVEEPHKLYTSVTIDSSHKVTDCYILQEKLGVGKFGQVFKLTHKVTGQVCAGKFYKGRRSKEREAARKEIELMNYLHHPTLVQCLAAFDHKPEMVMVMEFIAGGELFERIVDDNFEHTEPTSVHYMQQILEGVAYMHEQRILHLDLKPENIVCVDTTGTSIKIIDFGLACRFDADVPLMVMQGTPEFVAPEVINYEPVGFASDMWSIGVICYILLSGESPFQGNSDAETLALVTAAQWEFDEESFDEITDEAKDFISSLLNKDTRRRASCKEALSHPWMAAFESEDLATTKCLSKEKMKRFLARQKWKKAGKAMLALKRMALLSRGDSCASPTSPAANSPLSPEAEDALKSLEQKMQGPPHFTQSLEEQTVDQGSSVSLSCCLTGYPDPEVVWLRGEEPLEESPSVQIEYEEDGHCSLVLTKVSVEDTSVYTCRASNDHGQVSCSAKLTVKL